MPRAAPGAFSSWLYGGTRACFGSALPLLYRAKAVAGKELVVPELPEVENIALGLRQAVVGKRVARVWVGIPLIIRGPDRRRWRAFLAELTGRRIEKVTRRAKRLILAMEGGLALVLQLGMTGKFLLPNPEKGLAVAPKHTRLILSFRDGTDLLFVDARRFGRVWCKAGRIGRGRRYSSKSEPN